MDKPEAARPNEAINTATRPAGSYRWVICGLLFAAASINYVDRQILGVLKPTLQHDLGWNEIDYANIVFWFSAAYAIGYLGFGRLIDRVGARFGFAIAVIMWTIAHVAHAAVTSVTGFALARAGLGLGESGNFPAGMKAVAEWFPKRERALATSIFNSGTGIGAIITPLIVPPITLWFGWRAAFFVTGSFSLVWLAVWLVIYRPPRDNKRVTPSELAYIESDPPHAEEHVTISWRRLVGVKETWAYAIGKFLIDPIWWMYLFWLPGFFADRYQLDLSSFGPPVIAVFIASDIGGILGGWSSSRLLQRGFSLNAARKLTMLISCFAVLPIVFAMYADNMWLAVGILGVATAAHQSFSANLYTLPSDVFPRGAVGSVIGIGGTIGALGSMAMAQYTGYVLQTLGTYTPIFIVAALAYPLALLVVHVCSPNYAPANVG